jgi:hypothetical protein
MKIIREITEWTECPYPVKNHDYLVSNAYEFCHAMRKQGSDKWEKFGKRKKFNKAHRKFEVLNEKDPKEFVEPYCSNPWDSKTYNSLEMFM